MAIPDYETIMLPLMKLADESGDQELLVSSAVTHLANQFKLTEDERNELLPSGGTFKFASRVSWARTYLQKAGLLESTRRGYTRITKCGRMVLQQKPSRIDGDLLSQFDEFRDFQGRKRENRKAVEPPSETPLESIASHYEQLRAALA